MQKSSIQRPSNAADAALLHVAKLPKPVDRPPDLPSLWAVPDGTLLGDVHLPRPHGAHGLETLAKTLQHELEPVLKNVHRLAIWRVPPCVALLLTPVLLRLRIAPAWLNERWNETETKRALSLLNTHVLLVGCDVSANFINNTTTIAISPMPNPHVRVLRTAPAPPYNHLAVATDEFLFFTSGSGGIPKCARLSHTAMYVQAREKLRRLPIRRNTAFLHLAPLFHVGGASSALAALLVGSDHIIPLAPDGVLTRAPYMLQLAHLHQVRVLVVVPAILQALIDASHNQPISHIHAVLVGGARASNALVTAAKRTFPNANLTAAYGLTECASSIAFASLGSHTARAPTHVDLAVQARTPGIRGPVLTRGPHIMRGYIGEPLRHINSWFDTGDLGYIDNNQNLVLTGRARDVIRSAGESVYAAEVEDALQSHHSVATAAVVGVPHRILGEAVVAAVTLRENIAVPALLQWCRSRLSAFKMPRAVFAFESLPTNALGKIVKPAIREMLVGKLSDWQRAAKL